MRFYIVDYIKEENKDEDNPYFFKNSIFSGETKKHVIDFLKKLGYYVVKIDFVGFIKKNGVTEIIRF